MSLYFIELILESSSQNTSSKVAFLLTTYNIYNNILNNLQLYDNECRRI